MKTKKSNLQPIGSLNYDDEDEYVFKGKRSKKNTNCKQKKPKWQ